MFATLQFFLNFLLPLEVFDYGIYPIATQEQILKSHIFFKLEEKIHDRELQ